MSKTGLSPETLAPLLRELARVIRTHDGPVFVDTADFDGDNDIDFVTVNKNANNATVLLNQGNGSFRKGATLRTGGVPFGVTAADLFGFVPVSVLVVPPSPPFAIQPFGTSLGLVNADFQDPTHSSEIQSRRMAPLPETAPCIAGHVQLLYRERNNFYPRPVHQEIVLASPGRPFPGFDHEGRLESRRR